MKALTTIFATLVFANAAVAADSKVGSSAAGATVAGAQAAAVVTSAAAVQKVTTNQTRSRAEVRAEAIEALKKQKTPLAEQFEQYQ